MSRIDTLALKLPQWRSRLLLGLILLCFGGLIGRALYLQGVHNDFLRQKGDARVSRVIETSAHRGMITDRQGEPLAVSAPVESVWVSPQDFAASPEQLRKLASILEMGSEEIESRAGETTREFVYLKRHLSPELAASIAQLGVPGVFLRREYRRYYPSGEVMAHVLGFTGIDDNGQEGLELAYQEWLAGKPGSRRVLKDRLGRIIEDVESIKAPRPGRNLRLSIDSRIQYLAYRELKHALEIHKAKAGGIVVLDIKNGEVLALANLPTHNPNNRVKLGASSMRNRALTDVFEPGSTLKPFTAAAALEAGILKPHSVLQTAPLGIGSATVRDPHPYGTLTVAQVIQKSSNVGAAKMALSLPRETLWSILSRAGFGTVTGSGFPGEVSGKLRPHQSWRPIEQATISYGHGISVSLMQLARAYSVFASDGELMPVSLLKIESPAAGRRVISPGTAQAVRQMLEMVAQPGGTAPRARIAGYRVAGKTGTAHKLAGKDYSPDRYVSSFVGFAPASEPRLIVAVMIDEPRAGRHYGGVVAAPAFSKVMAGALRTLSVAPDAPAGALPLEDAAEVREEV